MVAHAHPAVEVRAMRREDVPAVAMLEAASYDFPWSPGIFEDCLCARYSCWVLRCQGQLAGYGMLSTAAGEAHVLNLCVGSPWRGQGLARHLLHHLLDAASRDGADRVFLEVRPSNSVARRLYDSLGFTEMGRRPRYYPALNGREDAIVMALELSGAA